MTKIIVAMTNSSYDTHPVRESYKEVKDIIEKSKSGVVEFTFDGGKRLLNISRIVWVEGEPEVVEVSVEEEVSTINPNTVVLKDSADMQTNPEYLKQMERGA